MIDDAREPDWPVTLTASPARRAVTGCAAAFFVPAAAVRLVGQADGSIPTDTIEVVGSVVLVLLAAILAFGTWASWTARVVVDPTEVEQRFGRRGWIVPLTTGTEVTLRRQQRGGTHAWWHLRLDRPEHRPVTISSPSCARFDTALLAVSLAGRHEPSLLADPLLRAVLRDPGLLGGSAAEVELAVADEEPAPTWDDGVDGADDGADDGRTGR